MRRRQSPTASASTSNDLASILRLFSSPCSVMQVWQCRPTHPEESAAPILNIAGPPSAREVMRSMTAVRPTQSPMAPPSPITPTATAAFPLIRGGMVGLAGLEPAASSLSGIEGSALCGPAFPQVTLERQGRSYAFLASRQSKRRRQPVYATLLRDSRMAEPVHSPGVTTDRPPGLTR